MRHPRRLSSKAFVAAAVACVAFGVLSPPLASAAPVDVPLGACRLADAPTSLTIDDATLGPYEGGWYALVDMTGTPIDHTAFIGSGATTPVCVAPVVGGTIQAAQATWAFCTQPPTLAPGYDECPEAPMSSATPTFTADERALAEWIVADFVEAGVVTPIALQDTQDRVLCITADEDSAPVPDCPAFRALLETNVLPNLVDDTSRISVAASGIPGHFTVSPSLGSLELTASGDAGIGLCSGSEPGVLSDHTLTFTTPGATADVCTLGGAAPSTLRAASLFPRIRSGSYIAHPGTSFLSNPCAIFLTESAIGEVLSASATVPAPTTTTTTPTTPTTTPDASAGAAGNEPGSRPAALAFAG